MRKCAVLSGLLHSTFLEVVVVEDSTFPSEDLDIHNQAAVNAHLRRAEHAVVPPVERAIRHTARQHSQASDTNKVAVASLKTEREVGNGQDADAVKCRAMLKLPRELKLWFLMSRLEVGTCQTRTGVSEASLYSDDPQVGERVIDCTVRIAVDADADPQCCCTK